MADNQELTEKELDFAIEYMRPMELWVSEMLQILKNNDIETKKQLTTTQQALDAMLVENSRYKKKKDDEQKVRECLFRDFTKVTELCAKTQQALDETNADLNFIWKWIERAIWDKHTSPESAISIIQHYDHAPWYKDRDNWDTSHKEYDAEINKAISDRQALEIAVEALEFALPYVKDYLPRPEVCGFCKTNNTSNAYCQYCNTALDIKDIKAALASIKE